MHWNVEPVIFHLGPLGIRWYGLFFATGVLLGAHAIPRVFEQRGLDRRDGERLVLWLALGMILGAHLIHLIFYEPRSFLYNPVRIVELGRGLASHGGGLGAIAALLLYCRRRRLDFHRHADASMMGALWVIPFVRIGNFFNSEIVGRATDLPWAVIFDRRGDGIARHPSQIYESLTGFAILALALWLNKKYAARMRAGSLLYLTLFLYFLTRFLLEYVKEYQVLPTDFPLTMGQCLSLPIALGCAYLLLFTKRFRLFPFLRGRE
jgi:phosphatidylglycerol:prolipoprotein diacylglycerol transferase